MKYALYKVKYNNYANYFKVIAIIYKLSKKVLYNMAKLLTYECYNINLYPFRANSNHSLGKIKDILYYYLLKV